MFFREKSCFFSKFYEKLHFILGRNRTAQSRGDSRTILEYGKESDFAAVGEGGDVSCNGSSRESP